MLTRDENELLCRVGPSTLMGDLMRRYWIPALVPWELPEPDGPPLRVRLLGEDLIAFRDSAGRVGLVGDHCPHRGASLFFGRNEEQGLRCVYHGWKFDIAGNCVDMPNEPAESNFKHKIKHTAYPCVQRGGIIWTYMGPQGEQPALPELETNLLPDSHIYVSKRVQESNYAQAFEGGIDSAHGGFLHSVLGPDPQRTKPPKGMQSGRGNSWMGGGVMMQDRTPRLEAVETDFGVMIAARRDADEGHYYWRINQFLMPFYTMAAASGDDPLSRCSFWVPMDDETTMRWIAEWHPARPLTEEELSYMQSTGNNPHHVGVDDYLPPTSKPGGRFYGKRSKANDYLIDRQLQKTVSYTGIVGNGPQDQAVQESMGAIYDRTKERLGTTDIGIIAARRMLIRGARLLRDRGTPPPGVRTPEAYRVRATSALAARDVPWTEAVRERIVALPGVNYVLP